MDDGTGIRLISGNSNRRFAEAIAHRISIALGSNAPLAQARIERFNDGEVFVEIYDNIRGSDAFVIQPTSDPANDNLMELLIIIDALKRSSARRITATIPYFGYARQDRKTAARTPISAKLVANLLTTAGADRILTMDLHSGQIQGFFDIPADNLSAVPVSRWISGVATRNFRRSSSCRRMSAASFAPGFSPAGLEQGLPSSTSDARRRVGRKRST